MDRNLSLEKIDIHDHVACFYRDEGERARGIARLARIGMERNERCYCILGECHEGDVRQALRELGMKENEVRYSPALHFLKAEELFLGGDEFSEDRCLDRLIEMVRSSESEGYGGTRFILEADPIVKRIGHDRFGRFESVWNESVDTERVACICLYDGENDSHSEVLAAVSTHPSLVIRGFLCRNYFYTPPEEFAQTGGCLPEAKQLLEKMLDIQICQISLADEDSGETNAVLEGEVARRERAERDLNETFTHHSEVLDGLGDGICLIDLDHRVLATNHAFERFREDCGCKGAAKGQILAQIWPLRVDDVTSSCDRAVWTGGPQRLRLVHLSDEMVIWYDLKIVPIVHLGRPDRILLVLHDSTDLHQARLALAEIRRGLELAPRIEKGSSLRWAKLLATLEHSPLSLFVQDHDGSVLYANPACSLMVGYSPEEMVGKSSSQLIVPDPKDFVNLERRTLLEGEEVSLWADACHKDGSFLPCNIRMVSLDSGSGHLLALLSKRDNRGNGQMTEIA